MTRLIRICIPLVLGPILAAGQRTPSVMLKAPSSNSSKQTDAQSPLKTKAAAHRTSHSSASARRAKLARRRAKRPEYRPNYNENSVEVINGDATKKVVFQDERQTASARNVPREMKNVPPPMKVDLVNGTAEDTEYFYGDGQDAQIEAMLNKPVVVGVESSDTRTSGGNKSSVVMRVNSAGPGDAKTSSSGGQMLMHRISPRPKRPEYQPDAH